MIDLIEEAGKLQSMLEGCGWKFCFIGGLAIQKWSEPRLTKDIDITLLTGFGDEAPYIDFLLLHFQPRLADARNFALANRVLLLRTASGIGIDIALGALPFEELAVGRSTLVEYAPGIHLRTCTAEDLLVMKCFADRPQDRNDVRGLLIRQGTRNLDWAYIYEHLTPLCLIKEEPEILNRLVALREEIQQTEP